MNGIGALVIARNEQEAIVDCLRSLAFCDERVLVDSFSTDATVERALPLADRVYRRTFVAYGEQKNWGLRQLTTPWALVVDADERVPQALAEELVRLAKACARHGYWIRRRNVFFGRVVHGAGWGRDRVLRFFLRERGAYDERAVHEEVCLRPGSRAGTCRGRLEHLSYADWDSTFERLLSYSTRGAADAAAAGRSARPWRLSLAPSARFLRQYVLQLGARDGVHGLVLCGLSGIGVFLRLAKLRLGEIEVRAVGPQGSAQGALRVETVKGPPLRL